MDPALQAQLVRALELLEAREEEAQVREANIRRQEVVHVLRSTSFKKHYVHTKLQSAKSTRRGLEGEVRQRVGPSSIGRLLLSLPRGARDQNSAPKLLL